MKFSQAPAKFEKDGEFEMYAGMIFGKNLEYSANEKLVQQWQMKDWEEASHVVITFTKVNESEHEIEVVQTEIPNHDKFGGYVHTDKLEQGWNDNIFHRIHILC